MDNLKGDGERNVSCIHWVLARTCFELEDVRRYSFMTCRVPEMTPIVDNNNWLSFDNALNVDNANVGLVSSFYHQ